MAVKVVATPCLQWSQPSPSHSPSSSTQTLASAISSLSTKKRGLNDGVSACRSAWLGTMSSKLYRNLSFQFKPEQRHHGIRRACSASFDHLWDSDDEFSRKIQELAIRFQFSGDNDEDNPIDSHFQSDSMVNHNECLNSSVEASSMKSGWLEIQQELPDWAAASIEMKANSVDLPLSLRMIKRKKRQWQEGFLEAGESAYCSVKKAFSSMVFIISELHSYSLQMRELLFYEDLQGIIMRVQKEMHASFVWLFQQVFSHTPILMVYVMILLANFTVHSMANTAAVAAVSPPPIAAAVEERESTKIDSIKSSLVSSSPSSDGKTTSVGGNNGGGSKVRPVASDKDDDGWMKRSGNLHRPIVPDGISPFTTREESVCGQDTPGQEEVVLWNKMVDEASRMQGQVRDEALDHETIQRFVSPVTAKVEADDYEDYFRTELLYQTGLAQEPNSVLLLANYAQFLYLVTHDYDRAEEYFKRAIRVEPKDAEAHNKYANFLWQVRKDLWAAEETFLEAISADPTNSFYAANYAHFLWNTGGEDTCFPLSPPDDDPLDA